MEIIILLVLLGLALYFLEMIPLASPFPQIIRVVIIIVAIVAVLQWLGVATGLPSIRIGR